VANSFGGSVVWLPTSRMTTWMWHIASSEQEDVTHACYHKERNLPQHLFALTKISAPTKTSTSVEMHLDESTTSGEEPQLVRLHG
jgi:hypothetical protein